MNSEKIGYRYSKRDFEYARLFDEDGGRIVTPDPDYSKAVMGSETAARYEANDDDCAVTVCCITYAHEAYIRQALDSFVSQKTNFRFKIYVGEDCGPDGTADIVKEYEAKYPGLVYAFCREENMGAQRNLIDLCNRANSPYIAFCEGDDFWIDDYKLQKQFDYMQKNKKLRMCYAHTEILAPEDWHLNKYFKHNKDGKMIMPECDPVFVTKKLYCVEDFVNSFPGHTSTAFYRWDYDVRFPEWFYQGIIGDAPITIMQMGNGKAAYLHDVASKYRRSDVGIFMHKSMEEHFIATRLDYCRFLGGLIEYFNENYNGLYANVILNRARLEMNNFLVIAERNNDSGMVMELLQQYPDLAIELLHTYVNTFSIYKKLGEKLGKAKRYYLCETNRGDRFAIPGLIVYKLLHETKLKLKKAFSSLKNRSHNLRALRCYWKYTRYKKDNNKWVVTSFKHNNYLDNSMYFYEYVVKNHPEIDIVWASTNQDVIAELQEQGKAVVDMRSVEGKKRIAHSAVAVIDHFAVTDFPPEYGFNDKTKVVQLWHGVGFKSMGDKNAKQVKNTTEKGVRYSDDILPLPGDGWLKRLVKRIKYYYCAPFRELFEKYFLFVCPGQERIDMIGKMWNVNESSYFMAGHPRDLPLYSSSIQNSPCKIMYAPTYRFDYSHELALVNQVLDSVHDIQKLMEEIDGEFYIRMHPHTWRNYSHLFASKLNDLDRIKVSDESDIYTTLGTYSVVITDYSSIGMDFANLDRPVIFHCPDYEWFNRFEAGFNLDFPNVIPGVMTHSWEETLEQLKLQLNNNDLYGDMRRERCRYFFTKSANGPDNSERIVQEIIRKLNTEN